MGNIHLTDTIFRWHWIHMGCYNDLKLVINGEIIINSAYMYLINLLPKRFRLSASSGV